MGVSDIAKKTLTMNSPQSIESVLGDANVYEMEIPVFQREYSWKVKEIDQLFDDILETKESRRNALLGLLVHISKMQSGTHHIRVQIVDGQQRTTTLSLLLGVLRSEIANLGKELPEKGKIIWGEVARIEKCLLRGSKNEKRPLLSFHPASSLHAGLYSGLILIPEDLENEIQSHLTREQIEALRRYFGELTIHDAKSAWMADNSLFNQTQAKAKNVRKNYLRLHARLQEYLDEFDDAEVRLDALNELTEVVLSRLSVIKYETSDEEEAFFLFETLNDRGMAVAASDLVKNFCILKDTGNIDEIGVLWGEIFKETIPDNVSPMYFLRTFHNSRTKFVTKKDLFGAYKELINNSTYVPSSWLRTQVLPDAKRFRKITKEAGLIEYSHLQNIVFCLNATNSRQWQTVALSSFRLLDDTTFSSTIRKTIETLLFVVLKSAIVLELKSKRGSILEKKLPQVAVKVHELIQDSKQESVVVERLNNIIADFGSYREDNDLGSNGLAPMLTEAEFDNSSIRPILAILRLSHINQGNFIGVTTVEHILPQKPDNKSQWPAWDFRSQEHSRMIGSIGNFLSLDGETNSSLGNSNFEVKRFRYEEVNASDAVSVNSPNHWRNVHSWTPEVVLDRSSEIIEWLVQILD